MENIIKESKTISILLVGNEKFTIRLSESLQICSKNYNNLYNVYVIICENVSEMQRISNKKNIPADFVIFLIDTTLKTCAKNVEYDLQLMSKEFVCGRMCIVNGNAHISRMDIALSLNDIIALKHKYSCPLLNANILDPNSCLHLADRLFTLIKLSLGIDQSIPFLPWLTKN